MTDNSTSFSGWVPPKRVDLVSIEELAFMRGVSVRTIRRYQSSGITPPRIRRCRQLMYRRADVENWLEAVGLPRK